MKYQTIFIEDNKLKVIEHDRKRKVSDFWCDNLELPMKGFTHNVIDEVTENYEEALLTVPNGVIEELRIINSFNITDK